MRPGRFWHALQHLCWVVVLAMDRCGPAWCATRGSGAGTRPKGCSSTRSIKGACRHVLQQRQFPVPSHRAFNALARQARCCTGHRGDQQGRHPGPGAHALGAAGSQGRVPAPQRGRARQDFADPLPQDERRVGSLTASTVGRHTCRPALQTSMQTALSYRCKHKYSICAGFRLQDCSCPVLARATSGL